MRYFIMALWGFLAPAALPAQTDLLLDDFHDPARPAAASRWEGFTDRVMGGLTSMTSAVVAEGDDHFLRMAGRVRTENNGGFLQMRLELVPGGKALDARPWTGVRLIVRGAPGRYAVHLRTAQNWFPWNFYAQPLPVTDSWAEVRLPFAGFRGDYGASGAVETRTLKSVAVVAIGQAFDARLEVKEIGLYR
jgi:hypothetical protein